MLFKCINIYAIYLDNMIFVNHTPIVFRLLYWIVIDSENSKQKSHRKQTNIKMLFKRVSIYVTRLNNMIYVNYGSDFYK